MRPSATIPGGYRNGSVATRSRKEATTAGDVVTAAINNSRISPKSNGNPDTVVTGKLSSMQKWWIAIITGVIFAIIGSAPAYDLTSTVSQALGGMKLGPGPNLAGLLLHTLIFIAVIRLILW